MKVYIYRQHGLKAYTDSKLLEVIVVEEDGSVYELTTEPVSAFVEWFAKSRARWAESHRELSEALEVANKEKE